MENRFEEKTAQLTKDLSEAQRKIDRLEQEQAVFRSKWNHGVVADEEHRAITILPPTSCNSLAQLGNQISGFYLVKDNATGKSIQVIYCEFKLSFNDPSN